MAPPEVRVLVVDADARVRDALTRLLDGTAGMAVVAVDPDQAVRLVRLGGSRTADVAVVDVPRDDAGDTVRALAAHLAVVAVGLHSSRGRAALRAGAVEFLEKDGEAAPMLAAIRAAAAGSPRATGASSRR